MPGVFPCGDGFCTEDSALEGWGGFLYYLASLGNWIQVFSLYTFYYLDAIHRDELRHVSFIAIIIHSYLLLIPRLSRYLTGLPILLKVRRNIFIPKYPIRYPPRHAMIRIASGCC